MQKITEPKGIVMEDECTSFVIVNTGATVAEFNGLPLQPGSPGVTGDSIAVSGNNDEIFTGRVDISFPAGNGEVMIFQQLYVNC